MMDVRPRRGARVGRARRSIWRSAWARRRCSSRRSATSGTVELAHGLAEGREKLLREPGARARRRAGEPRGGRLLQPRVLLPRHARLRDGDVHSRPAARSATSTTCSPGTSTWAAGRRTSRSTTAAGPRPRRSPRENLERTHGSLPHSRFRSLLVARASCTPAAATPTPGRRSTRRWPSPSRRTSWTRSVPSPSRGRRRAGSPARTGLVAEETADALARAERQRPSLADRRARDLAPPRAGLPHAGAERLPPPYRAELTGDVRAAAEFWAARGCRYDAALALAGRRRGGRSARQPARAPGASARGPPRRSSRGACASAAPAACSSGRGPRRARTPPA